ncbi:AAA family ATPase [Pseudanabaena sp. PCC 6802]|uniref:AAA family ATPase n=1 Tax=Pseudanabaena sp. PCC 6802 TaxID=118173 RepID=UPI000345C77D|nr:ATP-binding protein [Pseudanabaena sp. PCC 6802]
MRPILAKVKNLSNFQALYQALRDADPTIPRMGLVHGFTGAGKSTAVSWLLNQHRGIYVRANAVWTPSAMLSKILIELGGEPRHSVAKNLDAVVARMASTGKSLFVDEADYLFGNLKLVETLRDIHDLADLPVVLIGMQGCDRRLEQRQQLDRRVTQRICFQAIDLEDAQLLADAVCEVEVAEDLVAAFLAEAKGSIAQCKIALSRIEKYAKGKGIDRIELKQWGDRPFLAKGDK